MLGLLWVSAAGQDRERVIVVRALAGDLSAAATDKQATDRLPSLVLLHLSRRRMSGSPNTQLADLASGRYSVHEVTDPILR